MFHGPAVNLNPAKNRIDTRHMLICYSRILSRVRVYHLHVVGLVGRQRLLSRRWEEIESFSINSETLPDDFLEETCLGNDSQ